MRLASMSTAVALITMMVATTVCAQGNLPQPVQAAVADLAAELNVAENEITVASFEEVTWPDASLGNPEPGRVYAQVQTPGYRVFLHAEGRRYEYHTDRGTRVTLVGSEQVDGAQQPAQDGEQQIRQRLAVIATAKRHLAGRLGIDAGQVYLAAVEERTWSSTALGVEQPGEAYAQVLTPGLRLVLEAEGTLYDYHTDMAGQVKPAGVVEAGQNAEGGNGNQAQEPPAVEMAITDLAGRLSMDPEGIAVEDVEEVQWPNSALGLPEPGMMYAMAVVPGHRIILEAKRRIYEYHTTTRGDQATVRYAGIAYHDDAEVSVLAMSRTEPTDGNNFFHLQRIDPDAQERETVVEFVSGFATTPDGRDLLVKRRTSRSSHELVHVGPDDTRITLAGAFDFTGMALRPDGEMLAYWARPTVTNRQPCLNIRMQPWADEQMPLQPEVPGVRPGEFSPGALVWTNDGLALTVRTDAGARSFFWTPDGGVEELGNFVVLGRIPRTRALLIRRAENNREVLAAFIPGEGETAVLADVPDLQSADAPVGEQWVVAATSGGGAPQVQRITWGGSATSVQRLSETENASVRISPVGGLVAAQYLEGDTVRVDLLQINGSGAPQTLTDAAGAVPVAN